MKSLNINWLALLAICFMQASVPSPDPTIFVASSPCDMIPRAMLGIPATAECEFVKWNLALQRDPRSQEPTFYKLHIMYGMTQPNTTGFMNVGNSLEKSGKWMIISETNGREVYRLNPEKPEQAVSFVKLDDKLLHLLDSQGKLMIGHAGWSYTLNRK